MLKEKWNLPTDWLQIVDEKNGVVCLVIMFAQEDLSVALKCFSQAVSNYKQKIIQFIRRMLSSVKNTKNSHDLHFNHHNSGSKDDFYL